MNVPQTLKWEDERLFLLDQRVLPHTVRYVEPDGIEGVFEAIRTLTVRGAPAIGVAAAYGLAVAMKPHRALEGDAFLLKLTALGDYLSTARPTAVNLAWSVRRMVTAASATPTFEALCVEAARIHAEDQAICRALGEHGVRLISEGAGVLTHCNAGALAVTAWGTATAPMYLAHQAGVRFRVFAGETRPLWQGARLTAWELERAGIDVTLICDSMAASLMAAREVDLVIVGADRVVRNGDVVNKIGTLNLAVLCQHFDIPFYVACPSPTFDAATPTGTDVAIEEREAAEVAGDHAATVAVRNPAFDVTPHALVTGYVTDRGLLGAPAELVALDSARPV